MCAVKKDLKGSRKRTGNSKKRGAKLEPKLFREFMENVGNVQATEELPQHSGFDKGKMPMDLEMLIVKAIKEMESKKSVGSDGIHVKMLRANKKATEESLKELSKEIGRTAQIPRNWLKGTLVLVDKKGRQDEPRNYRPLCLLSHRRKVLEKAYVWILDS